MLTMVNPIDLEVTVQRWRSRWVSLTNVGCAGMLRFALVYFIYLLLRYLNKCRVVSHKWLHVLSMTLIHTLYWHMLHIYILSQNSCWLCMPLLLPCCILFTATTTTIRAGNHLTATRPVICQPLTFHLVMLGTRLLDPRGIPLLRSVILLPQEVIRQARVVIRPALQLVTHLELGIHQTVIAQHHRLTCRLNHLVIRIGGGMTITNLVH